MPSTSFVARPVSDIRCLLSVRMNEDWMQMQPSLTAIARMNTCSKHRSHPLLPARAPLFRAS